MAEMVFRTEDVPLADRFDRWREITSQSVVTTEMRTSSDGDFQASLHGCDLGAVRLMVVSAPPMEARRPPKLVRHEDRDFYHIGLVLHGRTDVRHAGREASVRPHELLLTSSAYPYYGRMGEERNTLAVAEFPAQALPLPRDQARRLLTRALSARDGIGALVAGVVTRAVTDSAQYTARDAARLGSVVTDLLGALLAHELEAESALPPETHHNALVFRVRAFIDQHLGDPRLSPRTVAAAHHISPRYLHRLFQSQDTTVAAWIRRRRLERCRRDLADPAQWSVSIGEIATRWGFVHQADFSRAFRAAYGLSPRDYRHAVLREPGGLAG